VKDAITLHMAAQGFPTVTFTTEIGVYEYEIRTPALIAALAKILWRAQKIERHMTEKIGEYRFEMPEEVATTLLCNGGVLYCGPLDEEGAPSTPDGVLIVGSPVEGSDPDPLDN